MEELKQVDLLTDVVVKKTESGTITTIKNKPGLTYSTQALADDKTIVALKAYKKDETFYKLYSIVNSDGKVESTFEEEDGMMPVFFYAPNRKLWVTVEVYHSDKDIEMSTPVFNRSDFQTAKPTKSFPSDYIGTSASTALFLSKDWCDNKKPDKLLSIEFEGESIKQRKVYKLELPSNNKTYVSKGEIHLLAFVEDGLLHRAINPKGEVLQAREIPVSDDCHHVVVMTLSFTSTSHILISKGSVISILEISPDSKTSEIRLIDLRVDIFNIWETTQLADQLWLFRFTHEEGNGWFVVSDFKIAECFISANGAYQSTLNDEIIDLGMEKPVIAGVSKVGNNSYAMSFYPMKDRPKDNDTIVILNRKIE